MDETLSDMARLRREADRCWQLAAEATDARMREHFETLGLALDQLADLLRAAVTKVMN